MTHSHTLDRLQQATQWEPQLLNHAAESFGSQPADAPAPVNLRTLHAKTGELGLEDDLLPSTLSKGGLLSAKQ